MRPLGRMLTLALALFVPELAWADDAGGLFVDSDRSSPHEPAPFCSDPAHQLPAFEATHAETNARLCQLLSGAPGGRQPVCPQISACPWPLEGEAAVDPKWRWLDALRLPRGLSEVLVWGLWLTLIGGILAGLTWLLIKVRRDNTAVSVERPLLHPQSPGFQLPEQSAMALLNQAEREADHERWQAAAQTIYIAALRHLDQSRLVRYHPASTSGEYALALRRHPGLLGWFQGVAEQVERMRFGDGQIEPTRLRALIREAQAKFKHGVWIGLLAVLSTGLFGCQASAPRLLDSEAPRGFKSLYRHGLASNLAFRKGMLSSDPDAEPSDLVIITEPGALLSAEGGLQGALEPYLTRGISVLVVGDGLKSPHPDLALAPADALNETDLLAAPLESQGLIDDPCMLMTREAWQRFAGSPPLLPPNTPRFVLDPSLEDLDAFRQVAVMDRFSALVFAKKPFHRNVILSADHASIVDEEGELRRGRGCAYYLASGDLFSNASMEIESNRRFALTLLRALAFDRSITWLTDSGTSPRESAFGHSASLPLLFQATLTAILLVVMLGASFTPLRDPPVTTHQRFVEHAMALGDHYFRAGEPGLQHSAKQLAIYLVSQEQDRARRLGSWVWVAKQLAETHQIPEAEVARCLELGLDPKLAAPHGKDLDKLLSWLGRLIEGKKQS